MQQRVAGSIAIAALAGVLFGCAATRSVQDTVGGWFGSDPGSSAERPQARYSAAAGVVLRETPDAAAGLVGRLGLHEAVLRYKLENGYAYVKSEKTGHDGWVRERDLIEQLPAPRKPAVAAPAAAPEPPATSEQSATQEAPAGATEPTEPGESPSESPEKSIFDPY